MEGVIHMVDADPGTAVTLVHEEAAGSGRDVPVAA
jgi:hypothetical protein